MTGIKGKTTKSNHFLTMYEMYEEMGTIPAPGGTTVGHQEDKDQEEEDGCEEWYQWLRTTRHTWRRERFSLNRRQQRDKALYEEAGVEEE